MPLCIARHSRPGDLPLQSAFFHHLVTETTTIVGTIDTGHPKEATMSSGRRRFQKGQRVAGKSAAHKTNTMKPGRPFSGAAWQLFFCCQQVRVMDGLPRFGGEHHLLNRGQPRGQITCSMKIKFS
jgi:hypothetical protein